jgi:hypothetical protein
MNDRLSPNGPAAIPNDPIEAAMTRHNQAWMADGIVELVLGSFWFLWGSIAVMPLLFHDPILKQLRPVLILASMGAMPFVLRRAIRGWKERVSFPRTGYVELKKPPSKWTLVHIALGSALGYCLGLLFSQGSRSVAQWASLGLGVVMFLAMVLMAWRIRAMRLFALSWVVLAAAVASFVLNFRVSTFSGVLLLAYAFVCLLDGGLRLRSYLKQHPEPVGAAL